LGNKVRLVEDDGPLKVLGEALLPFERTEPQLDGLGDLHRVGVALFVDRQLNALVAVVTRNDAALFRAALDVSDVPEQHTPSGAVADDDAANLLHGAELVEHA